ncbi:MAG: hypothetical protein J5835_03410 [Bacteroidales bacterium]|nr:hypothetical protein [Bacteroidales bacterium]
MKPRHWSYIILLSLCTAFSAKAQSTALQAVQYERVLWEGASPADANAALLSRARCLMQLERWADASDAIDRLRLYALDKAALPEVTYLKALCKDRAGDIEGAYATLQEGESQGFWTLSGKPVQKSPVLAAILAMYPPYGHLYVREKNWLPVTLASYASIGFTVWQIIEGNWITAVLGGVVLVDESFVRRNVMTVPSLAEKYNSLALEKYVKEQLDLLDF